MHDAGILSMSHMHTRGLAVPQPCRLSAWCQPEFHFALTFARSLPNATLAFAILAVTPPSSICTALDGRGEFINNFKFLSIHSDGWFIVRFSRPWLVYNLCLFCADCENHTYHMTVRLDPWLFAFLPLSLHSYPYHLHTGAHLAHQSAP